MQDGSSDSILSAAAETYGYQTESLVLDPDDTALQPWRTARRTAKCRVPWPLAQDEYTAAQMKRENILIERGEAFQENGLHQSSRKSHKRGAFYLSQKIRTLSSIGGGGDQISDLRAEDGVMKHGFPMHQHKITLFHSSPTME
ncbi:hypothetical protein Tco_1148036 [Tanacetum coccineum]